MLISDISLFGQNEAARAPAAGRFRLCSYFFENTLHASSKRHSRESGNPLPENLALAKRYWKWIPAFAGMTIAGATVSADT
jgi:hypothetical protein